ncbi:IMPAD1 [Branchiostoma lanceolatum]|uniref:inositol-phosphate phosphatase n=1 Tax=Branchiostoma lanceolatum TaxID=7740 RepID=A0A8J9ZL62_BRALA|nr:IMPAD1 [Branchiostoma lanceolatum]
MISVEKDSEGPQTFVVYKRTWKEAIGAFARKAFEPAGAMAPMGVRLSPLGYALIFILIGSVVLYLQVWMRGSSDKKNPKLTLGEDGDVHTMNVDISMKELLAVSIDLAQKGGDRVREIREANKLAEKSKGETKEGANDPMTDGDLQSHIAIVHGFEKAFPHLKVVSEEHEKKGDEVHTVEMPKKTHPEVDEVIKTDQRVTYEDITVWVDPLDATQEYTEDLRQYVTTMVCVAIKGKPTIGVIHKPFEHRTAWAWVGHGHSKGLNVLERKAGEGQAQKIIVSRSHAGSVEQVAKQMLGDKTEVIPAGGAGYKVLSLFEGIADAYIHVTLIKKWDICAGNALLLAMNGHMTTLGGEEINYSAEGNPKNEGGLLATLVDHQKFLEKFAPEAKKLAEKH